MTHVKRRPNRLRVGLAVVLAGLILSLVACDDSDVVLNPATPNQAPQIVGGGPEAPDSAIDLRAFDNAPAVSAVVADADGLDDIAAVFLEFDAIVVSRLIARRADKESGCQSPVYAHGDTLPLDGALPDMLPGKRFVQMEKRPDGVYVSPPFCTPALNPFGVGDVVCDLFPAFREARPEFGYTPCVASVDWVATFVMYPPLRPVPTTVFITEADLSYMGVVVIAIDSGGLSDTLRIGDLRIHHMTNTERLVEP